MRFRVAAFRFIAAGIMLVGSWGMQLMLATVLLRTSNPIEVLTWAKLSGIYCFFALLLVGVPIAILDPSSYLENRLRTVLLVGIAGAVIAMVPPAGALFIFTVPLGFLSGAGATWAYLSLLSEYPDTFGVVPPR